MPNLFQSIKAIAFSEPVLKPISEPKFYNLNFKKYSQITLTKSAQPNLEIIRGSIKF